MINEWPAVSQHVESRDAESVESLLITAERESTEQVLGAVLARIASNHDDHEYTAYLAKEGIENYIRYRLSKAAAGPVLQACEREGFSESDYTELVERVTADISTYPGLTRYPMGGWVTCLPLDEGGNLSIIPAASAEIRTQVIPKFYRTWVPRMGEGKSITEQVRQFVKLLPKMSAALRDTLQIPYFQVKVPDQLNRLLRHRDSLVVHYSDPSERVKIQSLVDSMLQEAGVSKATERSRESGYDLRWNSSSRSEAYSAILGKIIASKIAGIAVVDFTQIYTIPKLEAYIQKLVAEIGSWPPKQLQEEFLKLDK